MPVNEACAVLRDVDLLAGMTKSNASRTQSVLGNSYTYGIGKPCFVNIMFVRDPVFAVCLLEEAHASLVHFPLIRA